MLSGDIERNPGPLTNNGIIISSNNFQNRLNRHGLEAVDVGGQGNCLFRAIAHQLYD